MFDSGLIPLISIIVPAYNAAATLGRCLDSVFSQTYSNIEVVAVDDGSTDGTPKLLDDAAGLYPKMKVVHQKNMGLSGARNTGIDSASGSMLFFLDSDDFIAPDLIETLYEVILDTRSDVAISGITDVDSDGSALSVVKTSSRVVDEYGFWEGFDRENSLPEHSEYVVSCGKLYRSELFESERFDLGKIHEDEFIIHRIISHADKIAFSSTSGYYYVQTPGSIMHTPSANAFLDTAEALLARCRYFENRGWWRFAFTAVCGVRGALSLSLEMPGSDECENRRSKLRRDLASAVSSVFPKLKGCVPQKALCRLFLASPKAYLFLKRVR